MKSRVLPSGKVIVPWMATVSDVPPRVGFFSIRAGEVADGDYRAALASPILRRHFEGLIGFIPSFELHEGRMTGLLDRTDSILSLRLAR